MDDAVAELVQHYRSVQRTRMQGLPFVNPRLEVEAIGFRQHQGDTVGVLLTPWFMNLVLLPGDDEYRELGQGASVTITSVNEPVEFTVVQDENAGPYLSAVLFRSVEAFPDQATAREVADEVLHLLFGNVDRDRAAANGAVTRRDLFRAAGRA